MAKSIHKKRRVAFMGLFVLLVATVLLSVYVLPHLTTRAGEVDTPPVVEKPGEGHGETNTPDKPDPTPPAPEPVPYVHPKVKGIYISAYVASEPRILNPLLQWVEETVLNGVVIDVKDDRGKIPWRTEVAWAKEHGAFDTRLRNVEDLITRLEDADIYPIARLVAFKDSAMAEAKPELAVKTPTGQIWRDRTGAAWLDPHNWRSWQYLIDVAKEAAAKGFREIQFDYVRFPSDGNLSNIVYPHATGQPRSDVIREFLDYARSELEPLGVRVSADIFGLVTAIRTGDMGIGHVLEDMYDVVHVVSPMVYPEHYAAGTFGIPDPDSDPYRTVLRSMEIAKERLDAHPNADTVVMRPWLQDFSLRHRYGVKEVQAQIQAVYDAGFEEWILWDPRCRYTQAAIPKR